MEELSFGLNDVLSGLDHWTITISAFEGLAYRLVMAGLAYWLFRRSRRSGSRELALGFGVGLILNLAREAVVGYFAYAYPPDRVFPQWATNFLLTINVVGVAVPVLIAIGFWKLCSSLVLTHSTGPSELSVVGA